MKPTTLLFIRDISLEIRAAKPETEKDLLIDPSLLAMSVFIHIWKFILNIGIIFIKHDGLIEFKNRHTDTFNCLLHF